MIYNIVKVITALLGYICVLIGVSVLIWEMTLSGTNIGILLILVGIVLIKSCWEWFIEKI